MAAQFVSRRKLGSQPRIWHSSDPFLYIRQLHLIILITIKGHRDSLFANDKFNTRGFETLILIKISWNISEMGDRCESVQSSYVRDLVLDASICSCDEF